MNASSPLLTTPEAPLKNPRKHHLPLYLGILLAAGLNSQSQAAVKPASVFSDNVVLQQKQPVAIWGTAAPSEPVTVSIQGQSAQTTAGPNGEWSVTLKPIPAGGPYVLTFRGKDNQVEIKNVLVGEVWLCSGQSNMEYPMRGWSRPTLTAKDIPSANDPQLRFLNVPRIAPPNLQKSMNGKWEVVTPDSVKSLTAVGYYFGRELRKTLGVPVGLINASYGGSPAQAWTKKESLLAEPKLTHYVEEEATYPARYPKICEDYYAAWDKYVADKAKFDAAKKNGTPLTTGEPQAPYDPEPYEKWSKGATHLYNGMIAPLIPFTIRGTIWYQGETNSWQGYEYKTLFPAMIQNWRSDFQQKDMPFLFVQLASFMAHNTAPLPNVKNGWNELREAQRLTQVNVPNTGMVVTTDLGDTDDVHPMRKQAVGNRLALLARATVYGEANLESSGPVLKEAVPEAGRIRVMFTHADGLKAIDVHDVTDDGPLIATADKLVGFEVAGADGKYFAAEATIDGSSVIVSSPQVATPVGVRYGWANYPIANLSNSAGLPCSPFKVDTWAWASGPWDKPQ